MLQELCDAITKLVVEGFVFLYFLFFAPLSKFSEQCAVGGKFVAVYKEVWGCEGECFVDILRLLLAHVHSR